MDRLEQYAQWIVANQDKQGTDEFNTVSSAYKELRSQLQQPPEAPTELEPNFSAGQLFSRGVRRGGRRLQSTVADVIPAMVGKAVGADEYAQRQMDEAAAKEQRTAEELAPQYESFRDVDGIGSGLGFFLENLGEQLPNLGVAVGTALTGGAAGAAIGGARAAAMGQLAGAGAGSYALNAPEVFQNVYRETGQMEPGVAAVYGGAAAALDAVLPAALARNLTGPMKAGVIETLLRRSGVDNRIARKAAAQALGGTAVEGMTEGAQEAISIAAERFVAENEDVFGTEEWNRILEASVRGALVGGPLGGVGGGVEGVRYQGQLADRANNIGRARESRIETDELWNQQFTDPTVELNRQTEQTAAQPTPKPAETPKQRQARLRQERKENAEILKTTTAALSMDSLAGGIEADIQKAQQDAMDTEAQWDSVQSSPVQMDQIRKPKPAEVSEAEMETTLRRAAEGMQGMPQEDAMQPTDIVIPTDTKQRADFAKKLGVGHSLKLLRDFSGRNLTDPAVARDFLAGLRAHQERASGVVAEKIEAYITSKPELFSDEVLAQPESTTEATEVVEAPVVEEAPVEVTEEESAAIDAAFPEEATEEIPQEPVAETTEPVQGQMFGRRGAVLKGEKRFTAPDMTQPITVEAAVDQAVEENAPEQMQMFGPRGGVRKEAIPKGSAARPRTDEAVAAFQRPQETAETNTPAAETTTPAAETTTPGNKAPWDMTREEFEQEEAKGMGSTWLNAIRLADGRIFTSKNAEHGDMIERIEMQHDVEVPPNARGWVWMGQDPKESYIGIDDLVATNGDFYTAYKSKKPKQPQETTTPTKKAPARIAGKRDEELSPSDAIILDGEVVEGYSTSRNRVEEASTSKTIRVHKSGNKYVVEHIVPAPSGVATNTKTISITSMPLSEKQMRAKVDELLYKKDATAKKNNDTPYRKLPPETFAYKGDPAQPDFSPVVADFAARGRTTPLIRKLMQNRPPEVQQILKKILSMNLPTAIRIGKPNLGGAGGYNVPNDEIVLDPESGLTEHVFLHELVHAALVRAIADPNNQIAKDFEQFFVSIKDQMGDAYGGRDVQEFAAELVSNPEFQALLKETKAPKSDSMWKNILNAIARFFGFRPHNYEKGIKYINDLLDVSQDIDVPLQDSFGFGVPAKAADATRSAFFAGKQMSGEAVDGALNTMSKIKEVSWKRHATGLLRLENIDALYGKQLPAIKKLINAVTMRQGFQDKRIKELAAKHKPWAKLMRQYKQETETLFRIAKDARKARFDLFNGKPTQQQQARFNKMQQDLNRLPKPLVQMYKDMREDYDRMYNEFRAAVLDMAKTPEQKKALEDKFNANKPIAGYVPFMRFGEFVADFTNTSGEREVYAFESPRQRKDFLARNQNRIAPGSLKSYSRLKDLEFDAGALPPSNFASQLMENLDVDAAVKNDIWQMYLSLYPEDAFIKRTMQSKEIEGMSSDMLRTYSNTMMQATRKLAQIKYMPELENAFREISTQATEYEKSPKSDGPSGTTIAAVAQNIADRAAFIKNPYYNPAVAFASSSAFNLFLLGNISSAIINLTALPLLAYPIIAGRYGFVDAQKIIRGAMRTGLKDGNWSAKYSTLYNLLRDNGQLEHTLAKELLEGGRSQSSDYFASRRAKVMEALAVPFSAMEKYSRAVTAIAAYEMALKGGNGVKPMSEKEAAEYALGVVKDVHTNATAAGAPQYMQMPLGRIFFTFKTFIWNSAFIAANAFHKGVWKPAFSKGASKEDQELARIARRQFLGIFGMSFALGGANGLPFFGALATTANMLNALFGDDDEPYNFRDDMRLFLGELGYKGPINKILNLEISNRAGIANGLLFREDPYAVENYGYVVAAMTQFFGPLGNYAMEANSALRYLDEGHEGRFFEAILPSALANPIKAVRYAVEGARTANGQPIDTDINAWNLAMQAFGFGAADVSSMYERRAFAMNYQAKVLKRRSNLLHKAWMGYSTGDMDLYREATKEIQEFRREYPELIQGDTVQRSIRARKEIERKMIYGLRINDGIKRTVQERYFEGL